MLIRIFRRTQTCTYSNFMLVQISRRSYRAYSCILGLILVLRNSYLYFRTYSYTEAPVSTTCSTLPKDIYLCLYQTYIYLIVLVGTTNLYSCGGTRRYYGDSLCGGTRRYYWTFTYITELILILPIRKYP